MKRGEIRWYKFKTPDKKRPVLVLTRDSILEYLGEITVAPITSTVRDIPSEVFLYFDTAFKIGLRQGEQLALRSDDIYWGKDLLHIKRAITRDEDGKIMIGRTKNRYSRRTIRMIPVMRSALEEQKRYMTISKGNSFSVRQPEPWPIPAICGGAYGNQPLKKLVLTTGK